jgi:hypothetical protein
VPSSRGRNDLYSRAVLVHLAVPHQVEPGPGEQSRIRSRGKVGDGEVEVVSQRATANNRFDDLERYAIVIRQRDLTRATFVRSGAIQPHLVSPSGGVSGLGHVAVCRVLVMLACKVRAVSKKGVRHVIVLVIHRDIRIKRAAKGIRRTHLHMGLSADGQPY